MGYTSLLCSDAGRSTLRNERSAASPMVRIEIVTPRATSEKLLSFLRMDVLPEHAVTACVEDVGVVRRDHFLFRWTKDRP